MGIDIKKYKQQMYYISNVTINLRGLKRPLFEVVGIFGKRATQQPYLTNKRQVKQYIDRSINDWLKTMNQSQNEWIYTFHWKLYKYKPDGAFTIPSRLGLTVGGTTMCQETTFLNETKPK